MEAHGRIAALPLLFLQQKFPDKGSGEKARVDPQASDGEAAPVHRVREEICALRPLEVAHARAQNWSASARCVERLLCFRGRMMGRAGW